MLTPYICGDATIADCLQRYYSILLDEGDRSIRSRPPAHSSLDLEETLELYKLVLRPTIPRNVRRAVAKALPKLLQCLKEASLPTRTLARGVIGDLAADADIYIRRAVADHAMQIFHIDRQFLLLLLRHMQKDPDLAIRLRLQPVALHLAEVWLVWYAETAGLSDTKQSRQKALASLGE